MHKIKKHLYGSTITPGAPSYPLNGNYAFLGVADFVNYPATALGGVMETTGSNGAIRGLGAGIRTLGGLLTSNIGNEIYKSALANSGKLTSQGVKSAFSSGLKNTFSGSAGLGFGMGAAGTVLSAIAGPKSEYEGLKGGTTQALDTAYDGIATGLSFIPGGQVVAGAMNLAKGVGNVLGSLGGGTDGMTDVDSVLGSSFFNWNIGALNGFGGAKTHKLNNLDFMNLNRLDLMWSGYADALHDNLNARTKSGKKYGMFSSGARRRANRLIDTANMNQEYLLDMLRGTELGNIRGNNMASINSIRYNQALYGGVKPVAIGKQGLKISDVRNIINNYHNRPTLSSISPVKPTIETFLNGGKPKYIKSDLAYYNPETDTVYYTSDEDLIHEGFHARPDLKLLELLRDYYTDLDDTKIQNFGGDLQFVKRFDNDPGHFYSPEELGARVHTAKIMSKGSTYSPEFFSNLRANETLYGDNMRDLLHMYNDENLSKIFNLRNPQAFQQGGKPKKPYLEWLKTVPQDRLSDNYDLETAYLYLPLEQLEKWRNATPEQLNDESYHLSSVAPYGDGDYIFLKKGRELDNPEVTKELQAYYLGKTGLLFSHDLIFDEDLNRYFYRKKKEFNPQAFKQGGQMNLIPEGSLHARLHHMEDADGLTKKGIPVVDNDGNQLAEIEVNEIIFRKEVTDKLEELAKDGSNKAAEEAGRLLVKEIFENTDDRTGLIEEVTGKTEKFKGGGSLLFSLSPPIEISTKDLLELQKKIDLSQLKNLEGAHDLALANTNKTLSGINQIVNSITNIPEQIKSNNLLKEDLAKLVFSLKLEDSKLQELANILFNQIIKAKETADNFARKQLYSLTNPLLAAEGDKLPEKPKEQSSTEEDIIKEILSLSPEKLAALLNILKYLKQ